MNLSIMMLRFFIIFLFSLIYGLERQRSHKPIGFGTFIFVSMGSCALAIAAILVNPENPLPLLAAIITGIGFLGAGALIKTTDKIFGFTSAASIWIFSIIGLVIGIGEYFIGGVIYFSVWIVILIDRALEMRGIGSYQRRVAIFSKKVISAKEIEDVLETKHYKIVSMEINKKTKVFSITVFVEGTKEHINMVPKRLYKTDWVESFRME